MIIMHLSQSYELSSALTQVFNSASLTKQYQMARQSGKVLEHSQVTSTEAMLTPI